MSFPTAALSGGQLNTLRNSTNATPAWFGNQYISTDANTVVFACQVAAVADTTSFIQFVFGTVSSGSAAAVRVDMTVFISRTNDIRKAYFVGRVHTPGATGTSTGTLYINETSIDLLIGDYVWVVDDYRIWPKLGRDVDGTFYTDYNIAFRQLLPHVKGLKRAYASWVTDGYYQIAFNITATAAASGASISSYLWEVGDGTFVVGNSASQNPTVKWPPGERYIHLTITDSGGRTLTRHVKIFAHHRTLYPPNLGFNGALIQGDVTSGYNATVNAFTGVSDLLDNTLIVVWTDEWYANTEGSLIDNVNFVGRFRSEANQAQVDPDYAILSEVNWTCEGTAAQMAREHNALVTTIDTASPAAFGEITNLTPWRAMWYFLTEFSTVANLHDVLIPDTSTTYRCLGLTTQGQSMLDVVNDIGQSINTALEFAPDGTTQFARDLRYESSSARGSALNVAGWTNQDFTG